MSSGTLSGTVMSDERATVPRVAPSRSGDFIKLGSATYKTMSTKDSHSLHDHQGSAMSDNPSKLKIALVVAFYMVAALIVRILFL